MRGAVLGAALFVWPVVAGAEGLGDEIEALLRARGCAMTLTAVSQVFSVMGHGKAELADAVAALEASGTANLSAGTLRLAPELCRVPVPVSVPPLPWIERRLADAPGCARDLQGLRVEAEGEGVPAAAFDRVAGALRELGRMDVEEGTARLRADLCRLGGGRDPGLDRVLLLGREGLRAMLGFLAMDRDCRLPLGDRVALLRDLEAVARARLFVGTELSPVAEDALRRRLEEALDDPGPAFRVEGEDLVAAYCLP